MLEVHVPQGVEVQVLSWAQNEIEKHPCGCFSRSVSRSDVLSTPRRQNREAGQEALMSVSELVT
jgi:hypothetical protein